VQQLIRYFGNGTVMRGAHHIPSPSPEASKLEACPPLAEGGWGVCSPPRRRRCEKIRNSTVSVITARMPLRAKRSNLLRANQLRLLCRPRVGCPPRNDLRNRIFSHLLRGYISKRKYFRQGYRFSRRIYGLHRNYSGSQKSGARIQNGSRIRFPSLADLFE